MSDENERAELVARLRRLPSMDRRTLDKIGGDAADALEAERAEIAKVDVAARAVWLADVALRARLAAAEELLRWILGRGRCGIATGEAIEAFLAASEPTAAAQGARSQTASTTDRATVSILGGAVQITAPRDQAIASAEAITGALRNRRQT